MLRICFEKMKDLQFLRNLGIMHGLLVRQPYHSKGFTYRRFNRELESFEILSFFGETPWSETYFVREQIANSQICREALCVNSCSFKIETQIDQFEINEDIPIYDVYIYHGFSGLCQNLK